METTNAPSLKLKITEAQLQSGEFTIPSIETHKALVQVWFFVKRANGTEFMLDIKMSKELLEDAAGKDYLRAHAFSFLKRNA